MRSRAEHLGLAALAALAGCGFGDGDPWGEVELALIVGLEPEPGRLDGDRIKTASDYRVALAELRLEVAEVALTSAGGAGGAFDPADPPPGYSLCHNGHCHADDGRLVAYADIAAELGGGAAATTIAVASGGEVALTIGEAEPVALACAADCVVGEPVTTGAARVTIARWSARGTAYDALTGEAARLPPEGLAFDLDGDVPIVWTLPVRGVAFGPGEELVATIDLAVALPSSLFDGVAWDTMTTGEAAAAVALALTEMETGP